MSSAPLFVPDHTPPDRPREGALLFLARGMDVLVQEHADGIAIPTGAAFPELAAAAHYLGALDGVDCYAAGFAKDFAPPDGYKVVAARSLFKRVDDARFAVAGRALAIVEWDLTHRFCGRCGQPTLLVAGERARRCPVDKTPFYPRIAPAIIVLITRGDTMLLAQNAQFPEPMFSTLAGFVEPGESLEECVAREVKEEVGIDVKNVRYFGSQPWPFGRSLMVGFTAEHAGGEITVDRKEISEAHWFSTDNLPRIPPKLSIARQLIDAFVERVKGPAAP
ncbi:NAD(+) diphosphatase [Myxococcus sp. SDU36]|uniref:NAD(+) diphosphatase n=1 Tax=Myxococcus sp. SDU36 TaxID=2831967 RepID=UPI002542D839|nr:NAD(+) diphosphatase [Myxococcus sp. SDU36]WIG94536.1 NAD(+) diphosphatase [Myxococcus sp. SDU36]